MYMRPTCSYIAISSADISTSASCIASFVASRKKALPFHTGPGPGPPVPSASASASATATATARPPSSPWTAASSLSANALNRVVSTGAQKSAPPSSSSSVASPARRS